MPQPAPIELGDLEEARENLLNVQQAAIGAPNQLRGAEYAWRNTQRGLREAVLAKEGLSDLDKAGWLLVINGAELATDLGEAADATIAKLHELDTMFKQPDTPILAYEGPTITTSWDYNFFKTSGEGITVELSDIAPPRLSVACSEKAKWFPALERVEADILLAAVSEPQAVEAMDVSRYVFTGGVVSSHTAQDRCVVIGQEAITAFVDKLLALNESDHQRYGAERAVYDIWTIAKHQGLRLDEQSEAVSEWLLRWQNNSAHRHAVKLVDDLRNGCRADEIKLDETATELGVTPAVVKEAALRYNETTFQTVNERLSQL